MARKKKQMMHLVVVEIATCEPMLEQDVIEYVQMALGRVTNFANVEVDVAVFGDAETRS
ncbi:MAG TPA: hypothetical protein VGH28_13940 [Polyangiaceae bacterium]|jgi:hypothetical protein